MVHQSQFSEKPHSSYMIPLNFFSAYAMRQQKRCKKKGSLSIGGVPCGTCQKIRKVAHLVEMSKLYEQLLKYDSTFRNSPLFWKHANRRVPGNCKADKNFSPSMYRPSPYLDKKAMSQASSAPVSSSSTSSSIPYSSSSSSSSSSLPSSLSSAMSSVQSSAVDTEQLLPEPFLSPTTSPRKALNFEGISWTDMSHDEENLSEHRVLPLEEPFPSTFVDSSPRRRAKKRKLEHGQSTVDADDNEGVYSRQ